MGGMPVGESLSLLGILGLCLSPVPAPHPWLGALWSSAQPPPFSDLVSSLPHLPASPSLGSWWGSLEW